MRVPFTKKDITEGREFMEYLKREVENAMRKGMSLAQMKQAIQLEPYKDWRYYKELREANIEAAYFIDATAFGDVLELAGVESVTGAESRAETGEPHAPEQPRPDDSQAITVCFALDHLPGGGDQPRAHDRVDAGRRGTARRGQGREHEGGGGERAEAHEGLLGFGIRARPWAGRPS